MSASFFQNNCIATKPSPAVDLKIPPVARKPSAPRFGGQTGDFIDAFLNANQEIKIPKDVPYSGVTAASLVKAFQDSTDQSFFPRLYSKGKVLYRVFRFASDVYRNLPKVSKKLVKSYLFSFGFLKDVYKDFWKGENTGEWFRKLACASGVPVMKAFQSIAQELPTEDDIRHRIAQLGSDLKVGTLSTTLRKSLTGELRHAKWELRKSQTLRPLLAQAPPVAQSAVQAELDQLMQAFNRDPVNAADPIDLKSLGKNNQNLVGAASTAQVYKVKRKSGTPLAIKVYRPEADEAYVKDYQRLLYRIFLFAADLDADKQRLGIELSAERQKQLHMLGAAKQASGMANLMMAELDPGFEKHCSEALKRSIREMGLQRIHIPTVYTETKRGFIEEFVQGVPLAQLPEEQRQQVMSRYSLDLVRLMAMGSAKHSDLTDGNVMYDAATNRLTLIDFGRTIQLDATSQAKVSNLTKSLFRRVITENQAEQIQALEALLKTPNAMSEEDKHQLLNKLEPSKYSKGLLFDIADKLYDKPESSPNWKGMNLNRGVLDIARSKYNGFIGSGNGVDNLRRSIPVTDAEVIQYIQKLPNNDLAKCLKSNILGHSYSHSFPALWKLSNVYPECYTRQRLQPILQAPDSWDYKALMEIFRPHWQAMSVLTTFMNDIDHYSTTPPLSEAEKQAIATKLLQDGYVSVSPDLHSLGDKVPASERSSSRYDSLSDRRIAAFELCQQYRHFNQTAKAATSEIPETFKKSMRDSFIRDDRHDKLFLTQNPDTFNQVSNYAQATLSQLCQDPESPFKSPLIIKTIRNTTDVSSLFNEIENTEYSDHAKVLGILDNTASPETRQVYWRRLNSVVDQPKVTIFTLYNPLPGTQDRYIYSSRFQHRISTF